MCFSFTFLLLGREQGVTFTGLSLPSKVFPCIRICQEPSTTFRQSSFPRGTAPKSSCSPPCLCMRMWRLEKTGASGSPSTTPEERLFPSLHPLGIGRAIPENRFFEQKEFISAIANVVVVSHGSRVELSREMCITCFPSADKTLGETPAPALAPPAAGTGPGGATQGGGNDTGASCRCRAGALLWKLGK